MGFMHRALLYCTSWHNTYRNVYRKNAYTHFFSYYFKNSMQYTLQNSDVLFSVAVIPWWCHGIHGYGRGEPDSPVGHLPLPQRLSILHLGRSRSPSPAHWSWDRWASPAEDSVHAPRCPLVRNPELYRSWYPETRSPAAHINKIKTCYSLFICHTNTSGPSFLCTKQQMIFNGCCGWWMRTGTDIKQNSHR